MKTNAISFDIFRYQILPKSRTFQAEIFGGYSSLEDLLAKKNDLFFAALGRVEKFRARKTVLRHKILHQDDSSILYRFAANRSLTRETEDFTQEEIANWPSFYVYVWNDPSAQYILVQERRNAFQQTQIVAKTIVDSINIDLGKQNLRVHFESLFLENAFWELVDQNTGKIKDVRFELITPNMSNISDVLGDDLKQFAKSTNAAQTTLDIQADPDSTILLDPAETGLKGLVTYSSEGGGNISVKIRGLSKRIHTKRSKKHIDITELELSGKDASEIADVLKGLLT